MKKNTETNHLIEELDKITSSGIQADKARLKADMCAQFADYREWIREYVTNAFDAMASFCRISGEVHQEDITVTVSDNGKGMNRERIRKFFTLYASEKDMEQSRAIGTHGIGKLSVASIPGQTHFELITSDGQESWKIATGKLDAEEDIPVQKLKETLPRGSTFRITFRKTCSLRQEMNKLKDVLFKYVRFLPFQISISIPMRDDDSEIQTEYLIHEQWRSCDEPFKTEYTPSIEKNTYQVQLALGKHIQEVYQNRVLISDTYNLLSHDIKEEWNPAYLSIRVNGSSFELPFGRHCLSNEEVLGPLSKWIRSRILPGFMRMIYEDLDKESLNSRPLFADKVEVLTSSLIALDPNLSKPWSNYDIIRTSTLGKLSMKALSEIVAKQGKFYIEDPDNTGIDYTHLDGPVVQFIQPGDLLTTLTHLFKDRGVSLKSSDLVFESPLDRDQGLTELQKAFEKNLGFHPGLLSSEIIDDDQLEEDANMDDPGEDFSFMGEGLKMEMREAGNDFRNLEWRVSHLVEKDFKTPCISRLFFVAHHTVILNLNHHVIKKLVALSKYNPKLAGHWGVSLCLEDSTNVLPYLTADTRDEILMLDGIAKLGDEKISSTSERDKLAIRKLFDEHRNRMNGSILDNLN